MTVYDNHSLFSDYYLQERLPDHAAWSEDVSEAWEAARALYRKKKGILEGANEAQTEAEFIRPLLEEVLGFSYEVQQPATRQGRRNIPDYALFARPQDKVEAQGLRDREEAYFERAVAVADAKYWGRPLDRRVDDPREELTNANPSFQIVNYLVATGIDWGLLSNARLWRLYYAEARSRIDTYYEVDLARILEAGDVEAFRYFYLFFRAAAFCVDPRTERSFLEAIYEGSVTYGAKLQERLKDLIFERIFIYLAEGFAADRRERGLPVEGQEDLEAIYHGTLRLLYRLLFLLHAEARDLLPVADRHGYYGYSLTRLKREVAGRLEREETLSTVSTDIWNDLEGLFRIIDRGDAALNVPRYNGGLFRQDDPQNAFLNQHRIADAYLAPAFDLLTREKDPETGRRIFIDYKTLDVEQLGSIYEGLLEFHLRVKTSKVSETFAVSGKETSLYLENDKGERKATGSYYTPHYIVEYIVEHTLGPVLEGRGERFCELMDEIEPRRQRLGEVEEKLAAEPERADAWRTRWEQERRGLREELGDLEDAAVDALLGIRVCDPAMGSGHFLVHAADWLAEHLIALLNEYPENPVLARLAHIREEIAANLEEADIAVDRGRLRDTTLLKRMVMKRCIYGVDLNPMATELAKLSLWLDSFTVGAPLSFLDHHLKVGNSLIGARVEEVRRALESEDTGQFHMFGGPFAGLLTATELMRDVAAYTDATFAEVERSAERYAAFEEAMLPYKRVLDLWVSRHFGNEKAEELLGLHGREALEALEGDDAALDEGYRRAVRRARALWEEKRFFHWELEFPEVFVDLARSDWKTNPGFDAVIGNPPYVRGRVLPSQDKEYFSEAYDTTYKSYDLYLVFLEQALKLIHPEGVQTFILPYSLLNQSYAEMMRRYLLEGFRIQQIVDLSDRKVFEEATVVNCIPVIHKPLPKISVDAHKIATYVLDDSKQFVGIGHTVEQSVLRELPQAMIRLNLTDSKLAISRRMDDIGVPFGHLAYVSYSVAAHSETEGKRKADYIFDRKVTDKCEPFVEAWEIERYRINYVGRFLHYDPDVARRPGLPELFETEKLMFRDVVGNRGLIVGLDASGLYADYSVICAALKFKIRNVQRADVTIPQEEVELSKPYKSKFALAFLNSRLADFYFKALLDCDLHVYPDNIRSLPIRRIEFTTPAEAREALGHEAVALYTEGSDDPLLSFVDARLDHEPEQADVVHDLLAHLAEGMMTMHRERQRLEKALDPFKFLDRGAPFVPFGEAFAEEIKYGEVVDSLAAHHDIDGLRLVPAGEAWELQVQLKLRDPADDWQSWQYEEDGNRIARRWAPVYRLPLDEKKACYYRHAFQVRDEFAEAGSFPGGYTRSTMKKLQLTEVPAYDPDADLTPLVELSEELEDVQARIARTDRLIDQIVYRLYGLTEEEVAVVGAKH